MILMMINWTIYWHHYHLVQGLVKHCMKIDICIHKTFGYVVLLITWKFNCHANSLAMKTSKKLLQLIIAKVCRMWTFSKKIKYIAKMCISCFHNVVYDIVYFYVYFSFLVPFILDSIFKMSTHISMWLELMHLKIMHMLLS